MLHLYYNSHIPNSILAMASKHSMVVNVCMANMLMLVSMTLTLMQGHSESEKAQNQRWIISTSKRSKQQVLNLPQR